MKQSLFKRVFSLLPITLVGFFSAGTSFATAIGPLNIANCAGGGFTITATTITWSPVGTVAGTGCIDTGLGTNVTYSGGTLGPGDPGNIKNLTAGGGAVDQFMTFQGTTLDFVLESLGPGVANTNCAALAVGQTCSVFAGSPFILTNLGGGNTSIALAADGIITDAGHVSNWFGTFSTQLIITPAQIQTIIVTNQGSVSSTHSAQLTVSPAVTTVPESSAGSLFILGGLGVLGIARLLRKA